MKGLVEPNNSGIRLVIKHGTICQESKVEREGWEPVEVENPETKVKSIKYIKRYREVEAMVKKIEWRDTEDKYDVRYQSWQLHLDAAGVPCVLEISLNSRVADRFMKVAENIKFTEPVEFRAWNDAEGKTALAILQNGENVPQKYTKDNPGDCPPPVKKIKGWNFDDQTEFLFERMTSVVIPRCEAANEFTENGSSAPTDESEREQPDESPNVRPNMDYTDDDIPF